MHRPPIADAASLADAIARLPEVRRVALIRIGHRAGDRAGPRRPTALGVTLVGTQRRARPAASGPSSADRRCRHRRRRRAAAARRQHQARRRPASSSPGRRCDSGCSSPGGARPRCRSSTARVVGIGAFPVRGRGRLHRGHDAWRDLPRRTATPADGEADMVLVSSATRRRSRGRGRRSRALRPDLRVLSNEQVVEQFNQNAFSYFRQISVVLSSMTLAFAFLLIATLLTMSVNQRLGEVAALRALGFPRRRIAANLLWESVLLVGVGGARRAAARRRCSRSCSIASCAQMPGVPERLHFFVFEPRTVVLHAALLVGHRRSARRSTRSGWRRGCRSRRRCGARSCRDRRRRRSSKGAT